MTSPSFKSAARAFLIWRKQQRRKNDPRFAWHGEKPPKRDDRSNNYFHNDGIFRGGRRGWK